MTDSAGTVTPDGSASFRYAADGRKLACNVQHTPSVGDSASFALTYAGNVIYRDGVPESVLFDGGYIDLTGAAPQYRFFVTDHLGSVRVVADASGTPLRVNHYDPYGNDIQSTGSADGCDASSRYRFCGKEWNPSAGLYDFGARYYAPSSSAGSRWTAQDPLAADYPGISPYAYCAGDPVNLVDRAGLAPIYTSTGKFLGTDDQGLRGPYIMMDEENFVQGMSHLDAQQHSISATFQEYELIIKKHYNTLPLRPDYDGFVTISEGVLWAREHPYAKLNPSPDNSLFIDAAKLDFGSLAVSDFNSTDAYSPQNLFNFKNCILSLYNHKLRSSVYALGRFGAVLDNQDLKIIRIINDNATVYDWNLKGGIVRHLFVLFERFRTGLGEEHGFNVYYYGTGTLR